MPVEPEPTPKNTNAEREHEREQHEDPLRVVAQPLEEQLLLPLRRLLLRAAAATAAARAFGAGRRLRCCVPLATVLLRLPVAGLAVDDRFEHSFRRAAEDDCRCRVLDRMVRAPRERHDRQVGALAGRQGTHLGVHPQCAGGVDRRELERLGAPSSASARRSRPAGHVDRRPHLLEEVERRSRTRASPCRGRPTTPAARRSASGAIPQPRSAFDRGQCATGTSALGEQRDLGRRRPRRSGRRAGRGRAPARASRPRACPVGGTRRPRSPRSGPVPCSSHSFSFALSARCVPTGMPSERHHS